MVPWTIPWFLQSLFLIVVWTRLAPGTGRMFVTVNTLFLLFRLREAALIRPSEAAILITVRVKSRITLLIFSLSRSLPPSFPLSLASCWKFEPKRELSMQITVRRFFFWNARVLSRHRSDRVSTAVAKEVWLQIPQRALMLNEPTILSRGFDASWL